MNNIFEPYPPAQFIENLWQQIGLSNSAACNATPWEMRICNSVTGGQKGSKQARHDLIPPVALDFVARVYGHGCVKYEERNWERGYKWGLSYAALQRHLNAFWGGEYNDPESGLPHLAHAAWHCLTLMTFAERFPQLDDRKAPDANSG